MMTHQEIEQEDVVERYVKGRLAPEERLAFEEHFFACDECFAEVMTTEDLVAGVREVARRDSLARPHSASGILAELWRRGWLSPAALVPTAAAVFLAVGTGWLLLVQVPHLRRELASERLARTQIERQGQDAVTRAQRQVEAERQRRMTLEDRVARFAAPEADVPLAILQSTRGADASVPLLSVPTGAARLMVWIAVARDRRFVSFRLRVSTADDRPVLAVEGLHRNDAGAVVASLPAERFESGQYVLRLDGIGRQQPTLVGEYILVIRRP